MGRHDAHRFAAEGVRIVIRDIDGSAAVNVLKEVRALGAEGLAQTVDVSDASALEEAVAEIPHG